MERKYTFFCGAVGQRVFALNLQACFKDASDAFDNRSTRFSDIIRALLIVAIVALMIIPLPTCDELINRYAQWLKHGRHLEVLRQVETRQHKNETKRAQLLAERELEDMVISLSSMDRHMYSESPALVAILKTRINAALLAADEVIQIELINGPSGVEAIELIRDDNGDWAVGISFNSDWSTLVSDESDWSKDIIRQLQQVRIQMTSVLEVG